MRRGFLFGQRFWRWEGLVLLDGRSASAAEARRTPRRFAAKWRCIQSSLGVVDHGKNEHLSLPFPHRSERRGEGFGFYVGRWFCDGSALVDGIDFAEGAWFSSAN
jgi:hypothetical protein